MILIARRNVWLGLMTGALLLGLFNIPIAELLKIALATISDTSILLLAVSVGLIPIIGGALELSGFINQLVSSLRLKSKTFLMIAPAFMGMLPMPGGALLSAPLISKVGRDINKDNYSAINVWFRHVLVLIYPLGAVLATSKMAHINLYVAILYLLPGFFLLGVLGYLFLLRNIRDNSRLNDSKNWRGAIIPVLIVISAPAIHLFLLSTIKSVLPEIPLIVGVSVSLILAFWLGSLKIGSVVPISKKMKPWKFFLIIIGMFLFLNVFKSSEASNAISAIIISKTFLIVVIAAFLGFVTGRVQLPVSILLPIYYSRYESLSMTPSVFSVMFFSVFIGYIISPVHPCVSVTLEYFQTTLKGFYKRLIAPSLIAFLVSAIISLIFIR